MRLLSPPMSSKLRPYVWINGRLVPETEAGSVAADLVGIRPCRDSVRLEADPRGQAGSPLVVHNYGHGGAGVTLSWGCADEVASLVGTLVT